MSEKRDRQVRAIHEFVASFIAYGERRENTYEYLIELFPEFTMEEMNAIMDEAARDTVPCLHVLRADPSWRI